MKGVRSTMVLGKVRKNMTLVRYLWVTGRILH